MTRQYFLVPPKQLLDVYNYNNGLAHSQYKYFLQQTFSQLADYQLIVSQQYWYTFGYE